MVERNLNQREHSRGKAEAIAVRFSEENTPRGFGAIDDLGIPLYVTAIDKRLVYVFSSTRWDEVEGALKDANISYDYKRGRSLSGDTLKDPDTWNKMEYTPMRDGGELKSE